MDMLGYMRRMARNNLWSNDRLYRAVLALGAGEFEAERTLFYFDMLEERGVGRAVGTRFNPYGEAKDLAEAQAEFDRKLVAFCDGLLDADLDRRVATDRGEAGIIPERIGDLLAHLFLHDIHHRGQVHAMLSGTSVEPPQLDEFLLDYDLRFRREEVERLGLADGAAGTRRLSS
jgi:uncharacterized damage-inducible protein DinB